MDGRLAGGGQDGNVKIWLIVEQELVAALCLRAGRNLTKEEWARYMGSDTPLAGELSRTGGRREVQAGFLSPSAG